MIIRIDQKSEDPLYMQIREQVIAAIAQGDLVPGDALPSVRSLASDLGINLHTVNKAYAVLRDEGYVIMRGRAGAIIADPADETPVQMAAGRERLDYAFRALAQELKAHGGTKQDYLARAQAQADEVYGKDE